jgi:hypothetical protein
VEQSLFYSANKNKNDKNDLEITEKTNFLILNYYD